MSADEAFNPTSHSTSFRTALVVKGGNGSLGVFPTSARHGCFCDGCLREFALGYRMLLETLGPLTDPNGAVSLDLVVAPILEEVVIPTLRFDD